MKIKNQTDVEIRKLADDLLNNQIFTDRHLGHPEDISMVFMPIALGAFSEWKTEELEEIGMVYEYISEAGPRSINGQPAFLSFKIINKHDTGMMFKYYEELKKAKEAFLGGGAANETKKENS